MGLVKVDSIGFSLMQKRETDNGWNVFCLIFRYPAINKPAGVVHWLKHSKEAENVDWVVILDADMIIRGPIVPWELGAEKGKPVAAYYGYYDNTFFLFI